MKEIKPVIDSLFSLLDYKNKNYGNAAAQPLKIFSRLNDKIKVGTRLDDKLARIKNSDELRKNDVADVMGYLMLAIGISMEASYKYFEDVLLFLAGEYKNNYSKLSMIYDIEDVETDFIFKDEDSEYSNIINRVLKYIQTTDSIEAIAEYDLINLVALLVNLCYESGWTNFDEFKD